MVFVFEVASAEVAAVVGAVGVHPGDKRDKLFAGERAIFVAFAKQVDELAFVRAEGVRRDWRGVAGLWLVLTPDLDEVFADDILIRAAKQRGQLAGEVEFCGVLFGIMAADTVLVEDGLDLDRVVDWARGDKAV